VVSFVSFISRVFYYKLSKLSSFFHYEFDLCTETGSEGKIF
jgi:hypothetical protein